MTARHWQPAPGARAEITAIAVEHSDCRACGAAPGEPCTDPGDGRTVHGGRWACGAKLYKRRAAAARLTPERREALARLAEGPKVPRAEIEAARTPAGHWPREALERWGVPWPPPVGWRRAIERDDE